MASPETMAGQRALEDMYEAVESRMEFLSEQRNADMDVAHVTYGEVRQILRLIRILDSRRLLATYRSGIAWQSGYDDGVRDAGSDHLTFEALREANARRCETHYHPVSEWSLMDWLGALTGEVGELAAEVPPSLLPTFQPVVKALGRLAGSIKRIRRKESEKPNTHAVGDLPDAEKLADEAADTVIYLDLLCTRAGVSLGEAVRRKFNQVSRERLKIDIVI